MRGNLRAIPLLLFGSGLCALVYQVVWMRELRLVFGISTAANAAVTAIFMGGLGAGSAILGRLTDGHDHPLRLYAFLELLVSLSALLTLLLLPAIGALYGWSGGTTELGSWGANAMRLGLAVLVLGGPTFLMGGTLPAAVRAATTDTDRYRGGLAMIYGVNTLGAVSGVVLATFWMLEIFGLTQTLILAALINALVSMAGFALARQTAPPDLGRKSALTDDHDAGMDTGVAGPSLGRVGRVLPYAVYATAGIAGFVFFLMEMVWYRMLTPLLGGTTYSFGLILAVALLGIGIGGLIYAATAGRLRGSLPLLAVICSLEAICLAWPFALGDRLVVFAALLQPFGVLGLPGHLMVWFAVTFLVVGPAAVVSGFQFPLLISILGRGIRGIGAHTGYAYACNTVGAIAGALAGGFGLMPALAATGCWKLAVLLLGGTSIGLIVIAGRQSSGWGASAVSVATIVLALLVVWGSDGPSSAWRQSPVGVGRVDIVGKDVNEIRDWLNQSRRSISWERDGVESSIGLNRFDGLSFIVNGKNDGNARHDAGTQVMIGLIGALMHPDPETAMVIGLGTGSSAGWLAQVPGMQRVDVVEIEPGVLEVARQCAAVNQHVMDNPRVRTILADAREVLTAAQSGGYDLIVSEPSNPYRAGIASLYTAEFYRSVSERLAEDGIFAQWVQAYDIDMSTVQTIYATLLTVFPHVETWQTKSNDMLMVCGRQPVRWSARSLRRRLAHPIYTDAMSAAWGTRGLEGLLSRYVANTRMARQVAEPASILGRINTDDRMCVEFDFARSLGRSNHFSIAGFRRLARQHGGHRPDIDAADSVSWKQVDVDAMILYVLEEAKVPDGDQRHDFPSHAAAYDRFYQKDMAGVVAMLDSGRFQPAVPFDHVVAALACACQGDDRVADYLPGVTPYWPVDATAITGIYRWKQKDSAKAVASLSKAFALCCTNPWGHRFVLIPAMDAAAGLALQHPRHVDTLEQSLDPPFSTDLLHEYRVQVLMSIASQAGYRRGASAVKRFEPFVPWNRRFLEYRLICYRHAHDPLAETAQKDLENFLKQAPRQMSSLLPTR